MKSDFKNLIKQIKEIRLSQTEKDSLRSKILEFISFNPIRGEVNIPKQKTYVSIFSVGHFVKATAFILIITIVTSGYGVSYAASSSLPGDKLYSIKVNVNEKIEEGFAFTPEAKILVQSKKVERRLEETQALVKSNKLSEDNKKIVEKKITEHVESLTKEIKILKEEGDVETVLETTSKLTPVLEIHKEILETKTEQNGEADSLIAKVEDTIKTVEKEETEIIATVIEEKVEEVVDVEEKTELENKIIEEKEKKIEEKMESVVENRINKALDNIEDLKKELVKEETEVSKEIPLVEEKITQNNLVEDINTKMSTESNLNDSKATEENNLIETKVDVKVEESSKINLMSAEKPITPKEISLFQATETNITEPIMIESAPIIESEELKDGISNLEIDQKIIEAEELLKKAKTLYDNKNFKEALEYAQQANKITNEIEVYRKIKTLEIVKNTNIENNIEDLNIATPVKAM